VGSLFHPARVPIAFEPLRRGDATGHITGSSDPWSGTAVGNNGRHRGGHAFGRRQSVTSLTLPSLTCGAISKLQQHVARGVILRRPPRVSRRTLERITGLHSLRHFFASGCINRQDAVAARVDTHQSL
jgi:hypothetical protein